MAACLADSEWHQAITTQSWGRACFASWPSAEQSGVREDQSWDWLLPDRLMDACLNTCLSHEEPRTQLRRREKNGFWGCFFGRLIFFVVLFSVQYCVCACVCLSYTCVCVLSCGKLNFFFEAWRHFTFYPEGLFCSETDDGVCVCASVCMCIAHVTTFIFL